MSVCSLAKKAASAGGTTTIRAPESLKAVHPLGKSPVVELDDGTVLAESGAIIEEILNRFGDGRLRPEPGSDERARSCDSSTGRSSSPPVT